METRIQPVIELRNRERKIARGIVQILIHFLKNLAFTRNNTFNKTNFWCL